MFRYWISKVHYMLICTYWAQSLRYCWYIKWYIPCIYWSAYTSVIYMICHPKEVWMFFTTPIVCETEMVNGYRACRQWAWAFSWMYIHHWGIKVKHVLSHSQLDSWEIYCRDPAQIIEGQSLLWCLSSWCLVILPHGINTHVLSFSVSVALRNHLELKRHCPCPNAWNSLGRC